MNLRYALPLSLLVAACGGDAGLAVDGGADLGIADLAQHAGDLAQADQAGADLGTADLALSPTYPAGPYGNTVGSIIPPLVWEGYADPLADAIATSKAYGAYNMNDLRLSGRRYAVVHVSSFS